MARNRSSEVQVYLEGIKLKQFDIFVSSTRSSYSHYNLLLNHQQHENFCHCTVHCTMHCTMNCIMHCTMHFANTFLFFKNCSQSTLQFLSMLHSVFAPCHLNENAQRREFMKEFCRYYMKTRRYNDLASKQCKLYRFNEWASYQNLTPLTQRPPGRVICFFIDWHCNKKFVFYLVFRFGFKICMFTQYF